MRIKVKEAKTGNGGDRKFKKEKSRRGKTMLSCCQRSPLLPPLEAWHPCLSFSPTAPTSHIWYSLNFVTRYCYVLPFSQALNVYTSNRVFKMNGTYGTRDSYGCCNNIRVFQITLLTKEQAKLHVSMFPWTRNSNGGICIFSLLPCG